MISLDISEYGDPLYMRIVRAPFSRYLKPIQQRSSIGAETVDRLPWIFEIPSVGDLSSNLATMRDINRVIALAGETSVKIPDRSAASADLIKGTRAPFWRDFTSSFAPHDFRLRANCQLMDIRPCMPIFRPAYDTSSSTQMTFFSSRRASAG
jgi:hypothetical protein